MIVEKITHQFEVVEEEAQFARNDVHNEALTDFKEMHSQRYVATRCHELGNDRTRLIQCSVIQGGPIQRASGLGNGLRYSGESISGGVRDDPCREC